MSRETLQVDHKSIEQRDFETRVRDAEIKVAAYLPQQLEVIDLIAKDLFCSGHPAGWSAADQRHWDDLDDVPVFTRGQTTHPAKLQWRIKAIRIMDILDARIKRGGPETVN